MKNGKIMGRPLDTDDVKWAASALGVGEAHVRAVLTVEAAGAGFLGAHDTEMRQPKILFEAHIFARYTNGRYNESHPRLSSARRKPSLYAGGLAEHDRLRQAATLDWHVAHRAASWGIFQIMGFNHEAAGYNRLEDFVGVQYISEGLQLRCGVSFIQSHELEKPLRENDWRAFARGYNGPAYARNRYHERLEEAFERFDSAPVVENEDTAAIQAALNRAGFNLAVDGIRGSRTDAALREFQQRAGLTVDGIAGPKTRAALGIE